MSIKYSNLAFSVAVLKAWNMSRMTFRTCTTPVLSKTIKDTVHSQSVHRLPVRFAENTEKLTLKSQKGLVHLSDLPTQSSVFKEGRQVPTTVPYFFTNSASVMGLRMVPFETMITNSY